MIFADKLNSIRAASGWHFRDALQTGIELITDDHYALRSEESSLIVHGSMNVYQMLC